MEKFESLDAIKEYYRKEAEAHAEIVGRRCGKPAAAPLERVGSEREERRRDPLRGRVPQGDGQHVHRQHGRGGRVRRQHDREQVRRRRRQDFRVGEDAARRPVLLDPATKNRA